MTALPGNRANTAKLGMVNHCALGFSLVEMQPSNTGH